MLGFSVNAVLVLPSAERRVACTGKNMTINGPKLGWMIKEGENSASSQECGVIDRRVVTEDHCLREP